MKKRRGPWSNSLKARVQAVVSKVALASARPTVYYELDATDPNAPYTSGPGHLRGPADPHGGRRELRRQALKENGCRSAWRNCLHKQPDLIVLGDNTYGGVTPEQVKARAGWGALNAVKQDQIFIFDDNTVSRPGPRLVDGLEAMAKLLHPDLFKWNDDSRDVRGLRCR